MQAQVPQLLTEHEAAKILKCSLSKLRNDRSQRRGLAYVKRGSSVRYSLDDVLAEIESCRIRPESVR